LLLCAAAGAASSVNVTEVSNTRSNAVAGFIGIP
jgi:hypothetical protein